MKYSLCSFEDLVLLSFTFSVFSNLLSAFTDYTFWIDILSMLILLFRLAVVNSLRNSEYRCFHFSPHLCEGNKETLFCKFMKLNSKHKDSRTSKFMRHNSELSAADISACHWSHQSKFANTKMRLTHP